MAVYKSVAAFDSRSVDFAMGNCRYTSLDARKTESAKPPTISGYGSIQRGHLPVETKMHAAEGIKPIPALMGRFCIGDHNVLGFWIPVVVGCELTKGFTSSLT